MTAPADDVKSLFGKALELATPADRAAFLDEACTANPALRSEVEGLLQALGKAGKFMNPASLLPETVALPPLDERPGTVIGPYKLLQEIGEGGMGTVFLAEQTEPLRRKVALKIIKPGLDSAQVIARFEAERQALAMMDHQNIAKVLDAGTTASGRPFFVMELVKGVSITAFCDENRLTPRQRLELFIPVCQAIQHAHQKGIIHRDIKPSNVLVALYDGKPVPKVIDFGIAKATDQRLTEKTLFTQHGQIVGTFEYMSPEQATLDALDVDTRSDIYSLGVLLYELLTGATPLDKDRLRQAALLEVLRLIREEEPPRPSTRLSASGDALPMIAAYRKTESQRLPALMRGELDWIVMKTLEKDRNRRYETANGLAMDVQRYLADEPVQACPPSAWYRFRKMARRNKAALMTTALVAAALVVGTTVSIWQAIRATQAEQHAQSELEQKKQQYERAEANYLKMLEAVDQLLTEVGHKELASMPHLEHVRRRLLGKALKFFEEFLQAKGADPTVRFEAGLAYRRVGDIRSLLGEHQQAEQAYGQAVGLLDQLRAGAPEKRVYRQELAHAYYSRASVLSDLGRRPDAEQANEQAGKLQQELVAEAPQHPDYQKNLARIQSFRGNIFRIAGRRPEAESALRESEQIMKGLVARYPDKVEYHRTLSSCQGNLARVLTDFGKHDEADKAHRRSADTVARAMKEKQFAEDQVLRHHELGVLVNYGSFLWYSGRISDGMKSLQNALTVAQKLVDDFPGIPLYREDLAGVHGNLGLLLRSHDEPGMAVKYLEQARAIAEKLAADYPTVPAYQSKLGGALSNLAGLLNNLRKPEQARPLLERAIKHQQEALRLDQGNRKYREFLCTHVCQLAMVLEYLPVPPEDVDKANLQARDLAIALAKEYADVPAYQEGAGVALSTWAAVLMKREQYAQALPLLEEAIGYMEKALRSNPKTPLFLNNLRRSYQRWAKVLEALKRPEPELEKAYRGWASTAKRLATIDPRLTDSWANLVKSLGKAVAVSNGGDASDWLWLAVAHGHLSRARRDPGQKDKARQWYEKAVRWMEQNQRSEELNRLQKEAAEALADCQNALWILFLDSGKWNEAETEQRAALALRKQLLAEFPDNPNYRRKLGDSHNNLGLVLARLKNSKEAETEYHAALDIRRKLVAEFPSDSKYAFELGGTFCNLGSLLKDGGRRNEALPWYAQAIATLSPVVRQEPKLEDARRFLFNSHWMRAATLDQSQRHDEAAGDWASAIKLSPEKEKPFFQTQLIFSRVRTEQFETALKDAEELAKSDSGRTVFNCACAYGLAHARTKDDKHAARAVELLREAADKGYRNVAAMKKLSDLNSLRARDDFRQLLVEMEKQK